MTTLQLLNLSLVFHIVGLTAVAGSTLVSFVMQGQFWKQYQLDKEKGKAVLSAASPLPRIGGIGFLLLILSGVSMMFITHGVFGEQSWFRVKMAILVIIIINGLAFGRRNDRRVQKLVKEEENGQDTSINMMSIRTRMNIFYLIQLALFVTIFTLSVFKFT